MTKTLFQKASTGVAVALFSSFVGSGAVVAAEPKVKDIVTTYSNIAQATYEDSLKTAEALKAKIDAFIKAPSAETLKAARLSWIASRVPYQQSEAYRFGNAIVDDWEGKVNAWPLDEGLIDYVSKDYGTESDENDLYVANIVSAKSIKIGGKTVDTTKISKELISETLHEAGDVEANVATGYHAIEFLLWGQDLNGTKKGAGNRPHTDFDLKNCTNGNCDRRIAYLTAATNLLIDDLKWMVAQWGEKGAARTGLLAKSDNEVLSTIFTGLGSLSYGELAGERMKLGLILHDPEEEHDCFSDNTHNSHYYDALGIQNVYLGTYKRVDGSVVKGASVSDLVKARDAKADAELTAKLAATITAMKAMVKRAETVEAYDQMIGEGNKEGNAVVQASIDGLTNQTKAIQRAVAALNLKSIEFEGSDSLDNPSKVSAE
ncbi:MAG: peptidase [Methyloligella sp.]|nr:MAG: peptidase [Methyloligella sp.]